MRDQEHHLRIATLFGGVYPGQNLFPRLIARGAYLGKADFRVATQWQQLFFAGETRVTRLRS